MKSVFLKHTFCWLLFISFLAGGLRMLRAYQEPFLKRDEICYINMGTVWAEQGFQKAYSSPNSVPPLLPYSIATGVKYFSLDASTAGKILVILAGMLLPISVYYIAYFLLEDPKLSLFAAFLAATQPSSVRIGALILRDGPYFSFFMAAIAFAVWGIKKKNIRGWFFFALASAIAVLIRKEGIELILFFCLWFPIDLYLNRQDWKKHLTKMLGIAFMVFGVYSVITIPVQIALSESNCQWSPFPVSLGRRSFHKYFFSTERVKIEKDIIWK